MWQKVILLLVSNNLNFFRQILETLMSKPLHVRSDCVDIMVQDRDITLEDQAVVPRGLSTLDRPVAAQQYHLLL